MTTTNGWWRTHGVDCAHEDAMLRAEPCTTIDDARRRIAAGLSGSDATAADIEECALGYLAGWLATIAEGDEPLDTLDLAALVDGDVRSDDDDARDIVAERIGALDPRRL